MDEKGLGDGGDQTSWRSMTMKWPWLGGEKHTKTLPFEWSTLEHWRSLLLLPFAVFPIWISIATEPHNSTDGYCLVLFVFHRTSGDVRIRCRGDDERGADREKLHHSRLAVDVDSRLLALPLRRRFSSTFTASAGSVKTQIRRTLSVTYGGAGCVCIWLQTPANWSVLRLQPVALCCDGAVGQSRKFTGPIHAAEKDSV